MAESERSLVQPARRRDAKKSTEKVLATASEPIDRDGVRSGCRCADSPLRSAVTPDALLRLGLHRYQ